MRAAPVPRWAVSLADLALLLLGFFILLHASTIDKSRVADSIHAAFGDEAPRASLRFEASAARLFEPGEARLTARAREQLQAIGADAAKSSQRVAIESSGKDEATSRFDAWELAAARVAAAARAVEEGGLAEPRIDIVMPSAASERQPRGHRIAVRVRREANPSP